MINQSAAAISFKGVTAEQAAAKSGIDEDIAGMTGLRRVSAPELSHSRVGMNLAYLHADGAV